MNVDEIAQLAAAVDDGSALRYHKDTLGEEIRKEFLRFLQDYDTDMHGDSPVSPRTTNEKIYVSEIVEMVNGDTTTLYVDFQHVNEFNVDLATSIAEQFYRFEPFLREAVRDFVAIHRKEYLMEDIGTERARAFYVAFTNAPETKKLRDMKTNEVGRLTCFTGTITRTSEVRPELLVATFRCAECDTIIKNVKQQFKYTEPNICPNATCQNKLSFHLDLDQSEFVDWQKARVQENSDEIPAGSMPRSIDVILRHELVERAKAGDKMVMTGTLLVVPDVSQIMRPGQTKEIRSASAANLKSEGVTGLKALGVRDITYRLVFMCSSILSAQAKDGYINIREDENEDPLPGDEEEVRKIRNKAEQLGGGDVYLGLTNSVAPAIRGHEDIKKGILLMLLGGVHKTTKEGINLRGDINICIVGDPSTAKSQFLKYISGFVPRSVYTSGKASSAAGLTAGVVRDEETGEFCIEAGALMLADNGICCIDEFEKMDPHDQTAIHEAMEQQTISIAKAGIKATLNARTSILAAANPIGGRYDKSKTLKANVDITPPIMSRFDLFFIVLDECNPELDSDLANHIVTLHQGKSAARPGLATDELQRFIKYARSIKPELNDDAKQMLVKSYKELRQNDVAGVARSAYRFTVRQLESLIRLSEALARMEAKSKVEPYHVAEARRLLERSIIHVDAGQITLTEPVATHVVENPTTTSTAEGENNTDSAAAQDQDDSMDMGDSSAPSSSAAMTDNDAPDSADQSPKSKKGAGRKSKGTGKGGKAADDQEKEREKEKEEKEKEKEQVGAMKESTEAINLSWDEYQRIAYSIAYYLKQEGKGLKIEDIITWYLTERTSQATEQELTHQYILVRRVIRRMITHDHILVDVTSEDQEEDGLEFTERVVDVHPNHPLD